MALGSTLQYVLLLACCLSIGWTTHATPQARIVGGVTVDINSAPHLVTIRYKRNATTAFEHRCSGTIYTENIILTTARCVVGLKRQQLLIVAGSSYRAQSDGSVYGVNSIVIHPDFDIWFIDNDMALIYLANALTTQQPKVIQPIKLAAAVPAVNSTATVAGWGAAAEYAAYETQLLEANVRIIAEAQCKKAYGAGRISAAMLCASGTNANGGIIDACQGDAGSALVFNGTAVGLVSWGNGCGREGYPGVYTNLTHFKAWIESEANKTVSEN
ncbi:trypsin alpha-3 [Ceratitis capitata]|uniref:(Mediterranean fruit fly) hypothetical protein n=1 Tax=Ceratitis capitata TaxID=7213 RepID=W8B791_CERCA|nr:trypsin alpha-3 [Ceratitis capitata]CAD7012578.1 unnamed protein product [Ceratitis capitata]